MSTKQYIDPADKIAAAVEIVKYMKQSNAEGHGAPYKEETINQIWEYAGRVYEDVKRKYK